MTITRQQPTGLFPPSTLLDGNDGISLAYAFAKTFFFFVKLLLLILLLGLLVVAFVAWIWVTGFRSGWEFFDWVYPQDFPPQPNNDAAFTSRVVYGLLILLFSPLAFFVDWSEELLKKNLIPDFSFPSLTDSIIPAVRKQLSLEENEFPCGASSDQ